MSLNELWYHDESEVDERHSWLGNSPWLIRNTVRKRYDNCSYSKVLALVEYARPDFILTVDGEPLISVEVTEMNPSGHNLPQRFSCLLRAAEMGIPSLYYYPEYSRRSTSDPNPRFLNVRIPLAQLRLSELFGVPSLSMFWPTDRASLMPSHDLSDHNMLARFMEYTLRLYIEQGKKLALHDPFVMDLQNTMRVKSAPNQPYATNASFRTVFPEGDPFTKYILGDMAIDPPASCRIELTSELLSDKYAALRRNFNQVRNQKKVKMLLSRNRTFVYSGTANKQETGPEHPYPGYLSLLDILYLRQEHGQTTRDRSMNLAFELPISVDAYIKNAINRPTGLNILMELSDLIILNDAIALGGWMRNIAAGAILVKE